MSTCVRHRCQGCRYHPGVRVPGGPAHVAQFFASTRVRNNNDKPWKSLKILRGKPKVRRLSFFSLIFSCSFFFSFFHFFMFSSFFVFHMSLFFSFFFFSSLFFFSLAFYGFPSFSCYFFFRYQNRKNRKNLIVNITIFLCENSICGPHFSFLHVSIFKNPCTLPKCLSLLAFISEFNCFLRAAGIGIRVPLVDVSS